MRAYIVQTCIIYNIFFYKYIFFFFQNIFYILLFATLNIKCTSLVGFFFLVFQSGFMVDSIILFLFILIAIIYMYIYFLCMYLYSCNFIGSETTSERNPKCIYTNKLSIDTTTSVTQTILHMHAYK